MVCLYARCQVIHSFIIMESLLLLILLYGHPIILLILFTIIMETCVIIIIIIIRASAMLKHVIDIGWTSVRLSVCPSHAGTLSKRLNILSCFLHHTIAHSFLFCVYQDVREIPTGSPPAGALNTGGV